MLLDMWRAFLDQLDDGKKVKWDQCFTDGTIITAKKEGALVGKTKRGKGTKRMLLADGAGTPRRIHVAPAAPAEAKLLEPTLK